MKITDYNYQLKKTKQKKTLFIFLYIILVILIINLIMAFLIYPIRQNSISMSPDIPDQSMVMVTPLVKDYKRGDLVLIKARDTNDYGKLKKCLSNFVSFFTASQLSVIENENLPGTKDSLRRIVGMPGDTIFMRDYVLYIKPKGEKLFLTEFEIAPKAYNVTFFSAPAGWDSSIGVKGSFEEIVLDSSEYFVLGDNRKSTDDSRFYGPVTKDRIRAKAILCYFPFNKFKFF